MRTIVVADGELSRRITRSAHMIPWPHAWPHVGRLAQRAVSSYRKNRHAAAAIVGDEHELSRGMHTGVCRHAALGTDRPQSLDLQAARVDGIRNHATAMLALEIVDFADCIQPRPRRVDRQPCGISNVIDDL